MSGTSQFADKVKIYEETAGDFGRDEVLTAVGNAVGFSQSMRAMEAREYKTQSEREVFKIFFASDPSIAVNQYVEVESVAIARTFRAKVLATSTQGNPTGTKQIWFIVAQDTTDLLNS